MSVIAPGVIDDAVLLQTLKFTLLADGYGTIVNIPLVLGAYPVTPVGSPLKPAMMTSVVAVLVAEVVTTVAQVPDEMALVPRADVPDAIVVEKPPFAPGADAKAVNTPDPVVVVAGAAPAPPPMTKAFAAKAAEEAQAELDEK